MLNVSIANPEQIARNVRKSIEKLSGRFKQNLSEPTTKESVHDLRNVE